MKFMAGKNKNTSFNYPDDETTSPPAKDIISVAASSTNDTYEEDGPKDNYLQKCLDEKDAIHGAQSVKYTVYSMKINEGTDIVQRLNKVGVTVLSLESLSNATMLNYMDAVTGMRLGDTNDEKCMLYTDRMGRVFNVIISGGSEGLANTWSTIESSYAGWLVLVMMPFLIRVVMSFESTGYQSSETMALSPFLLLVLFGWVLQNETSHTWLTMNLYVWGSNSIGAYVWHSGALTDYPRILLLLILMLAISAPVTSPYHNIFTFAGAILGGLILLSNIGARAWKKAQFNPIDSHYVFTPLIVILASMSTGICFPFIGLRCVQRGTNGAETSDVENITMNSDGRRARQNIALLSLVSTAVYLCSDIEDVQNALGFNYFRPTGIVHIIVGSWLLLAGIASMCMCHRLDSSTQKRIRPFLQRDESSPVGWIVPTVPNIIIDPSLRKGTMLFPCLSFGSDIFCSVLVALSSALVIWIGAREANGHHVDSFWRVFS